MKKIIQILLLMMFFTTNLIYANTPTNDNVIGIELNVGTFSGDLKGENLRTIIDISLLGTNKEGSMLSLPLYIATVLLTIFRDYLPIFLGLIVGLMAWQKMQGQQWRQVLTNGAGSAGILIGSIFLTEGTTDTNGNIENMKQHSFYLVKAEREFIKIGEDIADRLWMTLLLGEKFLKEDEYLKVVKKQKNSVDVSDVDNSYYVMRMKELYKFENSSVVNEAEALAFNLDNLSKELNDAIYKQSSNYANVFLIPYFLNLELYDIYQINRNTPETQKDKKFSKADINKIWDYLTKQNLSDDLFKKLEALPEFKEEKINIVSREFLRKVNVFNEVTKSVEEAYIPSFILFDNESMNKIKNELNNLDIYLTQRAMNGIANDKLYIDVLNRFFTENYWVDKSDEQINRMIIDMGINFFNTYIDNQTLLMKFKKDKTAVNIFIKNHEKIKELASVMISFRNMHISIIDSCNFKNLNLQQTQNINISGNSAFQENHSPLDTKQFHNAYLGENSCLKTYQSNMKSIDTMLNFKFDAKKGSYFIQSLNGSIYKQYINSLFRVVEKSDKSTAQETGNSDSKKTAEEVVQSTQSMGFIDKFFNVGSNNTQEQENIKKVQEIYFEPIKKYKNLLRSKQAQPLDVGFYFEDLGIIDQFTQKVNREIIYFDKIKEKDNEDLIANLKDNLKILLLTKPGVNEKNNKKTISWMELGGIMGQLKDAYTPFITASLVDINNNLTSLQRQKKAQLIAYDTGSDKIKENIAEAALQIGAIKGVVDEISSISNNKTSWTKLFRGTFFKPITLAFAAAKGAMTAGLYLLLSQLVIVAVLYILPAIFWMLAVLSWYIKTAIILAVLPLATFMLSFVNFNQIRTMILTLVSLMLTPIVLVSTYFIVIEITTILPILIDKFIPMLNSLQTIYAETQMVPGGDSNIYIPKHKLVDYSVDGGAIKFFNDVLEITYLLKLFIQLVLTTIIYGYFLKSNEYINMIIGHSVSIGEDGKEASGKIQQAFKMNV